MTSTRPTRSSRDIADSLAQVGGYSEEPAPISYTANWVARDFHSDRSFIRGLMGPVGCGKSHAAAMEIFLMGQRQKRGRDGLRRSRFLAIRATNQRLMDTTIEIFHSLFPPNIEGGICTHNKSEKNSVLRFNDVIIEVHFRALDDKKDVGKVLSVNVTGAWFNEWSEVDREIHMAVLQRCGRYPPQRLLAEGQRMDAGAVILDYNPPSPDSWQHNFFEIEKPTNARLHRFPSGLSEAACNLENLAPDYYVKNFIGFDEAWKKAYRDGEYADLTESNAVFSSYRESTHSTTLAYAPELPLYVGLDFGMSPTAVFAQRDGMGRWSVIDELCEANMDMTQFAPILHTRLRTHYPGATDRRLIIHGDPSGAYGNEVKATYTVYSVLSSHGIRAFPCRTNEVDTRLMVISQPLGALVMGVPRLRIDRSCIRLKRAMSGGYHFTDKGHVNKNEHSHVVDALGYLLLGAGEDTLLNRSHGNQPDSQVPRYAGGGRTHQHRANYAKAKLLG